MIILIPFIYYLNGGEREGGKKKIIKEREKYMTNLTAREIGKCSVPIQRRRSSEHIIFSLPQMFR